MLLEVNFSYSSNVFNVCLAVLKVPDFLKEPTESFMAYRQVLEALRGLAGFQVRKPNLELKNLP